MKRIVGSLAVAAVLLGPTVPLVAVALFVAPSASTYCLTAAPPIPTVVPGDQLLIPETSRVVLPLPEGTYIDTVRFDVETHPGLDLAAPGGTPILAIADGIVTTVDASNAETNTVELTHTVAGSRVVSQYRHMWPEGIRVDHGSWVSAGQQIADVGAQGAATGPHLHFGIWTGDLTLAPVDPLAWLSDHNAALLASPSFGGPACGFEIGLLGSPTPFDGDPEGRVPDPTGTGGWVTPKTAHMVAQTRFAFPDSRWACWSPRPGTRSDHPLGRACDVTFGNRIGVFPDPIQVAAGWRMALWLQQNAATLNVQYLIWQGLIWSATRDAEGWRPYNGGGMHDPTTPTGGHFDHLHISVVN